MSPTHNYVIQGYAPGRQRPATTVLVVTDAGTLDDIIADLPPNLDHRPMIVDDQTFHDWKLRALRQGSKEMFDKDLLSDVDRQAVNIWPSLRLTQLRDSQRRPYISFTSCRGLPRPLEKEIWNALHAARMTDRLADLHNSPWGMVQEHELAETWHSFKTHELHNPMENSLSIAQVLADPQIPIILAHPDFTTMMLAAASTANLDFVQDEDLLSPDGIVYFTKETDLGTKTSHPARAIMWRTVQTLTSRYLLVRVLVEGRRALEIAQQNFVPGVDSDGEEYTLGAIERLKFLTPVEAAECEYTQTDQDTEAYIQSSDFSRLIGLVVSISAIARSTHTRSTQEVPQPPGKKKKRASRRRAAPTERSVRVLSLINPEYADYERRAAQQDGSELVVTRSGVRAHWVRGHWRRQWYASSQSHRTIWIDGFVKGDPNLGTMGGRKVYSARLPS